MNIIYNKNKPLYTQKKKGASTWITKTIKITSLTPKCKAFGNILFLISETKKVIPSNFWNLPKKVFLKQQLLTWKITTPFSKKK